MWKAPTTLVAVVLILLALGIVMLASASSVKGEVSKHDAAYYLKRQIVWILLGMVAALAAASVDYHFWHRRSVWVSVNVAALVLLALVVVPGIGSRIGGSFRWLKLGSVSFQPSELAKITTVMLLAGWLTEIGRSAARFVEGIVKPGAVLALILGLILREPDYGTTILVATVAGMLLYVGGGRPYHLMLVGTGGFAVLAYGILHDPVRTARILAFLFPDIYRDAYYQLGQSIDSFTLGGLSGAGLGESLQKHFCLPEANTDFILSIMGEELGIAATLAVLTLFALYLVCGVLISVRAPDIYGRLLGFGLTLMTVVQAAINVGVVTGCLPTKGIPLPFISYGGSSLLMSLAGVGILINIARHGVAPESDIHTRAVQDRTHWV